MTGMFLVSLQIIAVIERNFLTRLDVAQSRDPNPPLLAFRLAIGGATMIDITRGIPFEIPVQVKFPVQRKDAPVLPLAAPGGFRLGYFLAEILDDARATVDNCFRENALAVDR
jgi:hypothetical protein